MKTSEVEKVHNSANAICEAPIYLINEPNGSFDTLEWKAQMLIDEKQVQLIIIDGFELFEELVDSEKEDYILVHLGCYSYCKEEICEKKSNNDEIVPTKSSKTESYVPIKNSINNTPTNPNNNTHKTYSCEYKKGKYYDSQGSECYHKGLDGQTDLEEIHKQFIDKYYYNSWEVTGKVKIEEVLVLFSTYNFTIKEAEDNFEEKIDTYPICYSVACTGEHQSILPFPKNQAEIVNPFMLSYNFLKGYYYGWIEMDYADIIIAKKFIDTNFYEYKIYKNNNLLFYGLDLLY
jgi:hypothetical protein